MTVTAEKNRLTDIMAAFIGHTAKYLPDDVLARLQELWAGEDNPLALEIYDLMFHNLDMAARLDRPTCQDTGVLQFLIRCGTGFPLISKLEELLIDAVRKATVDTPLRHNAVETFDEYNTGDNTGAGAPTIWWEIVPDWDGCEIYTYMAGGGCSLPGHAMVLMPGQGYEGAVDFVMERMTSYGLNACPPLLVGVGIGTTSETAALNAKRALLRPVGSHNANAKAAKMEQLLEDGINAIGFGPQGMGGKYSVMGVNIVNTARHPATLGVAVTVACWSHRRGLIRFDRDLNYTVMTHSGFTFNDEPSAFDPNSPYAAHRERSAGNDSIESGGDRTDNPAGKNGSINMKGGRD